MTWFRIKLWIFFQVKKSEGGRRQKAGGRRQEAGGNKIRGKKSCTIRFLIFFLVYQYST
ncbi:MAG: hypothetical protein F6K41_43315 [Symploca sp. SIO3E6]|nr:hypothetical protein [Caldora sp. SIO3E6]